jgi:hypothetical protein
VTAAAPGGNQRRWPVIVLAIALVAALAAGGVLLKQRNDARDEADAASAAEQAAIAAGLADRLPVIAAAHADTGMLVAAEANRLDDNATTRDALARTLLARAALLRILRPKSGHYVAVAPIKGGGVLASTGTGEVDKWTGSPLTRTTLAGASDIQQLAASNDGTLVALRNKAGEVIVVDTESGHVVVDPFKPVDTKAATVAMSSDGTRVVAGTDDGKAAVFDAKTGDQIGKTVSAGTGAVSVALAGDDLVAAGADGNVTVADAATGSVLRTFAGAAPVRSIDAAGRFLALGADFANSVLLDLESGSVLQLPIGQPQPQPEGGTAHGVGTPIVVTAPPGGQPDPQGPAFVALSRDGLVAFGANGPRIAQAPTGEGQASDIDAGVGAVRQLVVTPNGSTLLVVGDGVALWSLGGPSSLLARVSGSDPSASKAAACAIAGRNLTQAEWRTYFPGVDYHATCG